MTIVSSFSLIFILAALFISGLFLFSLGKKLPELISKAKDYSEHLGFKNSRNAGQLWMRAKWFGLGFLITFLSFKCFFFPFILAAVIIEAIIVFIITQKKSEYKAKKRLMYFLGVFFSLILYLLIILLLYVEPKDWKMILFDFVFIIILIAAAIIGTRRNEQLTTGETRCIKGNITNIINYKQRLFLIPLINNVLYEYEFILNGITYKGSDGESVRQKKKRGSELINPVEIEYSITAPQNSRLTAIKHRGKTSIIIITIIASAFFALHCVFFTDFIQTVKTFLEMS